MPSLRSLSVPACFAWLLFAGCSDSPDPKTPTAVQSADPAVDTAADVTRQSGEQTGWMFRERTSDSGVTFQYRNGEEAGHFSILESLGGGLSAFDFDRDGHEDLCLAGGGHFRKPSILPHPTGLFRGVADWKWTDVSNVAGVSDNSFYSHGIARTDFDQDGFADFAVTGYGGIELYHNLGDGTFERLGNATGLNDTQWSSSAAWGDINGDQFPDLYVAHYVNWSWENDPFCEGGPNGGREICPPRSYTGLTDTLYLSLGDGSFQDASSGIPLTAEGKGLGTLVADFDNDGDNDVYVTNDTVANFLYENTGNGKLRDISLSSGSSLSSLGVPDGSMGVDACDFNSDGLPEIWVVNYERESNAMYQNAGGMVFRHISQRIGLNAIGAMYVGWGTTCQDFDRDGDEDIFVSNGHVIRYPRNAPLNQTPLLLENTEGKRLTNVAAAAGSWMTTPHMGRGAVAADFDWDGDMDLAISCTNQPAGLLENTTPGRQADWIGVRLIGVSSARDPVGARVQLIAGTTQTRFIKGGGSYGSSQSDTVLFAIPATPAEITLEIQWPSGIRQTLKNPPRNQHLMILEADSQTQPPRLISRVP